MSKDFRMGSEYFNPYSLSGLGMRFRLHALPKLHVITISPGSREGEIRTRISKLEKGIRDNIDRSG